MKASSGQSSSARCLELDPEEPSQSVAHVSVVVNGGAERTAVAAGLAPRQVGRLVAQRPRPEVLR